MHFLAQYKTFQRKSLRVMGNIFSACLTGTERDVVEVGIPELSQLITRYLSKDMPKQIYNSTNSMGDFISNDGDVEICADLIVYAELRGNNQGIVKLVAGALKANPHAGPINVVHDTVNSAKVNGGQRIGMCVVSRGVDIAIEKASGMGNVGIVGCSNYSSATGAIGYWARKISRAGHIGIVMSQCNELVAPHGSYEPIFG
jgi:LDH2 family malate/lactate/ureidoglycolate dehydrogenase